jgi:serine/threonine protein kinase
MEHWFLESGGQVTGPHSQTEVLRLIQDGQAGPEPRVSRDRATWMPVDAVRGQPTRAEAEAGQGKTIEAGLPSLPGYEIQGVLGRGGMGVVYVARQVKLGRLVALKTVPFREGASEALARRFAKEAEVLAQLSHPNIVQVFDFLSDGQAGCFVMELLEGEDLHVRLCRAGPLGEREAWSIIRQAAGALAHAARQGIYHRDIKPANLFLTTSQILLGHEEGHPLVKVMDFGLAFRESQADSRLTAAGVILGTPAYMAPEQASSAPIDHRADIYALGATAFQALSGKAPFTGETIWAILGAKAKGVPRLGPPVSSESAALVADMMAPDPAQRIDSYEELLRRIDSLPAMQGLRPASPPPRRAWPWRPIAAAVALALACGGAWWWLTRPGPPPPAGRYVSTGQSELLFDGKNLPPWSPVGGEWRIEDDFERSPVLAGTEGLRRRFRPYLPNFRLTLGLDLHEALSCEVSLEGEEAALRLSRKDGVAAGRRTRETFEALGQAIPYPTSEQLEGKSPYLEIRIEQAGGRRFLWFDGRRAADWPAPEPPRDPALSVRARGGKVRIAYASMEELRPEGAPTASGGP